MIDTHCHIDFANFDEDRDKVLRQAKLVAVSDIIVPSVCQKDWHKTIQICQIYSQCHLALGLHPMFIEHHQPHHLNELDELIAKHKPLAVGEIGLDFYQTPINKEKQLNYFTKQLIIAKRHSLPVIIHNRKAHDQCLQLLQEHRQIGGVIHAFNGSIQQAHKYLSLGFKLGFGGMITFERSVKLRSLVEQLPLHSIVLETDAPDMTVAPHKGERNSPEYLHYVARAVAEIKKRPLSEVISITTQTSKELFAL